MYIQITTRCNMECGHCCYSCGPKTGSHMPMSTYKKSLALCEKYGETPFLGGGEPTVHPKFWEFLGLALSTEGGMGEGQLGLITNGKRTKDALTLASLAKRGVLSVELSRDSFHEEIDEKVVEAFKRTFSSISYGKDADMRGTRDGADRTVYPSGRGVDYATEEKGCVCPDMVIDPEGRIWACGCKSKQFGTVDKPEIPEIYWEHSHDCWEEIKDASTVEELANAAS